MKANELMIGDWVLCKSIGNRYAKIDEIYSKSSPPFKRMLEIVSESDLSYCVPIEELEPIPLTEDILKANGFEFDYESSSWAVCEMYLLHGHKAMWSVEFDCVSVPINYVHELQHALRLCGFGELADNFKVTP